MSKKQSTKPTVGDAFGHLTGFFKTTGLLAIRGVNESAQLVANVSHKAFEPSKKKGKKAKRSNELDINKTLKRIEKNFAKLEQRDLELADHITRLQNEKKVQVKATPAMQAAAKRQAKPRTNGKATA